DTTAFLVDQHGRITPDSLAKRLSQARNLRGRFNVACEDNEAPRIALPQERAFRRRQACASNSSNESACRHRRGLPSVPIPNFANASASGSDFGIKGILATL